MLTERTKDMLVITGIGASANLAAYASYQSGYSDLFRLFAASAFFISIYAAYLCVRLLISLARGDDG